jgi:hypothetical protein
MISASSSRNSTVNSQPSQHVNEKKPIVGFLFCIIHLLFKLKKINQKSYKNVEMEFIILVFLVCRCDFRQDLKNSMHDAIWHIAEIQKKRPVLPKGEN